MSDTQRWPARILTVSDGVVHGTRDDLSGQALAGAVADAGFDVDRRLVCADGVESVAAALTDLCAGFAGLVITTGGTGFAPRDQTPEGTMQVVERPAPGLAEAMRAINPLGRLSRGVAGIVGTSIVINTPGSTKGCVEQFQAVADVLAHALRLLNDQPSGH
ncbi:MAG TPA: MogA/MoaB family molybdenum cofactor biosynthesis protein [Ilumatobacteraceae bacterium]|nr:MogA/MoaB family molybdenum cofactor biosynthesis protein [Ilumatobacteraceae bacterium]